MTQLSNLRDRLEAQAMSAVLQGTQWLSADEVGGNPELWKAKGLIFALQLEGEDRYPQYALGPDLQPLPVVEEILAVFSGYSPKLLAAWFDSTSRYLRGSRPRELLATDAPAVLAAARHLIETSENQA